MQRHNVTCRTHITLPHCPVTNALNGSLQQLQCIYNVSQKSWSWPLNSGLQQHINRNFFWDTLYVPRMCEIYKSFQVTPHCTEQTLCTVWRKSWPCFRKLPRRQHVDMHGLQLRIPIPDPVWSLHSCLGLRVWKTSDKTFCQHGHVSSGDHSGHVCHVVVSDTLVF